MCLFKTVYRHGRSNGPDVYPDQYDEKESFLSGNIYDMPRNFYLCRDDHFRSMPKVLIIDDEEQLRKLLARIIGLEGYEVLEAADGVSGLKKLRQESPDVVLCDVKLPDGNGVEMVGRIKEIAPAAEVILLTAYGNIPDGVQAIKNGAFDYITKGDDNHKILPLLSRAAEKAEQLTATKAPFARGLA